MHWFGHLFRSSLVDKTLAVNKTIVSLMDVIENPRVSLVNSYLSCNLLFNVVSLYFPKYGVGSKLTRGILMIASINLPSTKIF